MATNTLRLPVLTQASSSALPLLYARWIEEMLGGPIPNERHATCTDCAMCKATGGAATANLAPFNDGVKCCTYVPTLWNFLVGNILADNTPQGRSGRISVELRMQKGIGVTPLGLQPSPEYALIYKYGGKDLFGRSTALRCPHYVEVGEGQCGIWRHRNAVCATYFCKFERGATGKAFWQSLLEFLTIVERELALWCATSLGASAESLQLALLPYFAASPDTSAYTSSITGCSNVSGITPDVRWTTVLPDFYRESARMVEALSWREIGVLCGPEAALQARLLQNAYATLRLTALPERLRLAAVTIVRQEGPSSLVAGYSSSDVLVLATPLVEALFRFDGQLPTERVLSRIHSETGIDLDRATIVRLVDFGILVAMPDGSGSESTARSRCG